METYCADLSISCENTPKPFLNCKPDQRLNRGTAAWHGVFAVQVNPSTGVILSQRDVWDSVNNNRYLSAEAVTQIVKQVCRSSLCILCILKLLHVAIMSQLMGFMHAELRQCNGLKR